MKISPPRRIRAFTIVEIMIAIAIFTMIIIAIYSSWTAILKGSQAGLAEAAAAQRDRMTMRSIEDVLTTAQMFGENIRHYSFVADTSGDFATLSLVSRLPPTFPGSGLFGDQVVRRVSFFVQDGNDRSRQLVMTQAPLLTADLEADPYSIVLARDVDEFILEFWDQRISDWITEWTATNQLPRLMRISLSLANKTKSGQKAQEQEITTRIVQLPATIVQREWQLPGGIAAGRLPPGMRDGQGTNVGGGEMPRGGRGGRGGGEMRIPENRSPGGGGSRGGDGTQRGGGPPPRGGGGAVPPPRPVR